MNLYSWGSNSHGQLGLDSDAEQFLLPTQANIDINVEFITGGGKHTVILTSSGNIFLCGDNDKAQLGKEVSIPLVKNFQPLFCPFVVVKVSCGWDFNLALTESGEVLGWGSNSFGQLGLPKKSSYLVNPKKIFNKNAVAIGTGLRHSAIVCSDGLVHTSGFGRKGQLGILIDGKTPLVLDQFVQVKNISNCQAISCGERHCVTLTKSGKVFSWGDNCYGQLGIDPKILPYTLTPTQIDFPFEKIKNNELFSGWSHNVVLTEEKNLITWGRNDLEQLGENRKYNWKPEIVKNLKQKIKQVAVGSHHTVILTTSGSVLTWGWNEHGNCGNGDCCNVKEFHELKSFKNVKLIGSGSAHSFLYS